MQQNTFDNVPCGIRGNVASVNLGLLPFGGDRFLLLSSPKVLQELRSRGIIYFIPHRGDEDDFLGSVLPAESLRCGYV